ncbi:MAG: carboxypeptidase regulatory-like domain-containing protein [Bryobacteraceae bacterium]
MSLALAPIAWADPDSPPDIRSVAPDLTVPPVSAGEPGPGRRVRQSLPEYSRSDVHHLLYLPGDWKKGKQYPVMVDYPGNGRYRNGYGDVSTGEVEDVRLGYGITGGQGFLWVSMPFVNPAEGRNQITWWGDVDATVDYCIKAVRMVCEEFGGDPSAVILTGFSRRAIACNAIGLSNDRIADIWLAFVPYSHYDGVRRWDWPGSDRESALARLGRLRGRASFICHEASIENTRRYLQQSGVEAPFTFETIPFRNHNPDWALRDIPARRHVRRWLRDVLDRRPGTSAVNGRVVDGHGQPVSGVRIVSGDTHWTLTDPNGRYALKGLTRLARTVSAGVGFEPAAVTVDLRKADEGRADFRASP